MNEEKKRLLDKLREYYNEHYNMSFVPNSIKKIIDELNPVGSRRPIHKLPNRRMAPVPWVNGEAPYLNIWTKVDVPRRDLAAKEHLCFMCGKDRGDTYVYALYMGTGHDSHGYGFISPPMATFGHPKCVLWATLYCPYLVRQKYPVGLTKDTGKMTHEEFRQYVKGLDDA